MEKFKRNMMLFFNSLIISAFTFGGGYVIIAMMQKKYVVKKKLLTGEEMMDIMTLAQSSPGPVAVNTSLLLGFKLSGIIGAIACLLGTIIPPLVIITIVSNLYDFIAGNAILEAVMHGMEAGIAAIITDVVLSLVIVVKKEKNGWAAITLPVAFVMAFMGVNVLFIILPALAFAICITLFEQYKRSKKLESADITDTIDKTIEEDVLPLDTEDELEPVITIEMVEDTRCDIVEDDCEVPVVGNAEDKEDKE